jgi:hypothetical protein
MPRCSSLLTMARRTTLSLLAMILIASILSYALNYFHPLSIPALSFLYPDLGHVDQARKLSIPLHPEDHVGREPRTINLHWDITQDYRSPDGVRKLVYLINGVLQTLSLINRHPLIFLGAFPGPTLEARSGDTLVVEVSNLLQQDGVSFHWHGLHMKGTYNMCLQFPMLTSFQDANHMDGVVGVTQNAISPGATLAYKFQIEETQAGTFWYYALKNFQARLIWSKVPLSFRASKG